MFREFQLHRITSIGLIQFVSDLFWCAGHGTNLTGEKVQSGGVITNRSEAQGI